MIVVERLQEVAIFAVHCVEVVPLRVVVSDRVGAIAGQRPDLLQRGIQQERLRQRGDRQLHPVSEGGVGPPVDEGERCPVVVYEDPLPEPLRVAVDEQPFEFGGEAPHHRALDVFRVQPYPLKGHLGGDGPAACDVEGEYHVECARAEPVGEVDVIGYLGEDPVGCPRGCQQVLALPPEGADLAVGLHELAYFGREPVLFPHGDVRPGAVHEEPALNPVQEEKKPGVVRRPPPALPQPGEKAAPLLGSQTIVAREYDPGPLEGRPLCSHRKGGVDEAGLVRSREVAHPVSHVQHSVRDLVAPEGKAPTRRDPHPGGFLKGGRSVSRNPRNDELCLLLGRSVVEFDQAYEYRRYDKGDKKLHVFTSFNSRCHRLYSISANYQSRIKK